MRKDFKTETKIARDGTCRRYLIDEESRRVAVEISDVESTIAEKRIQSDIRKYIPESLVPPCLVSVMCVASANNYAETFTATAKCHDADKFSEKAGCITASMKAERQAQRAIAKQYADAAKLLENAAEVLRELSEKRLGYAADLENAIAEMPGRITKK